MRRKITNQTWEQIKTAYAAGIELCEIARKMNIPDLRRNGADRRGKIGGQG